MNLPAANSVISATQCFRRPLLLSFSGIDGAGKSTQIENLCTYLFAAGLPTLRVAFWDDVVAFPGLRAGFSRKFLHSDGAVGAPGRPAFRHDKNTQKWYLTIARALLFLTDAINLRRVVRRAGLQCSGVIVFDRYIYDQLATLPLHLGIGRAYARLLLRMAPTPDIAYLLDAIPEAARERKPEYPVDFMRKYRTSYLRLQGIAGLTLIGPLSKDEVHLAIVQELQRRPHTRVQTSGYETNISDAVGVYTE